MTSLQDAYEMLKVRYPSGTVHLVSRHRNREPDPWLRLRMSMSYTESILRDLEALGVTVTPKEWEEAVVSGEGWEGTLDLLATLRTGTRLLARVLYQVAEREDLPGLLAENPYVTELAGTIIDWENLLDGEYASQQDVVWALVALVEQAGKGRPFADDTVTLTDAEEILAVLLADIATSAGMNLDDWYTYEELEQIVSSVRTSPELLDVAERLAGNSRTVSVQRTSGRPPGRGV